MLLKHPVFSGFLGGFYRVGYGLFGNGGDLFDKVVGVVYIAVDLDQVVVVHIDRIPGFLDVIKLGEFHAWSNIRRY